MENFFKMLHFEFLIGSATQYFIDLMIVIERIEQSIKVGTVNSEVMMEPTSENGF
jgi:hypothetical protein